MVICVQIKLKNYYKFRELHTDIFNPIHGAGEVRGLIYPHVPECAASGKAALLYKVIGGN